MSDTTGAEAEATGPDTITVEWRGHSLNVPAFADDVSIDVMEALEEGRYVAAIRGLVGDEPYAALKVKDLKTKKDFRELSDTVMGAMSAGSTGE